MRKSTWIFAAALGALMSLAAAPARADDGEGLTANGDRAPWSRWQGRIAYGSTTPLWRSGLGGFESGGLNVARPGSVDSISLMGDYYFARPWASAGGAGGFRATSGMIVGPRSQLAVTQPGLGAGGLFSIGSRPFGPSSVPATNGDLASETAALPYVGLGYTGLSARGSLSFSADLGMVGQAGSDATTRPFGAGPRSVPDAGRDTRLMPMLQLGVLYSF